jgi:hypothetical protein
VDGESTVTGREEKPGEAWEAGSGRAGRGGDTMGEARGDRTGKGDLIPTGMNKFAIIQVGTSSERSGSETRHTTLSLSSL